MTGAGRVRYRANRSSTRLRAYAGLVHREENGVQVDLRIGRTGALVVLAGRRTGLAPGTGRRIVHVIAGRVDAVLVRANPGALSPFNVAVIVQDVLAVLVVIAAVDRALIARGGVGVGRGTRRPVCMDRISTRVPTERARIWRVA